MPALNEERWLLIRHLYETYRVSVRELAELAKLQPATVARICSREGWTVEPPTLRELRGELVESFHDYLEQLRGMLAAGAPDEKGSRMLQIMARTLESVANVERRMEQPKDTATGEPRTDRNKHNDDPAHAGEETLDQFTADFERFVETVERRKGNSPVS